MDIWHVMESLEWSLHTFTITHPCRRQCGALVQVGGHTHASHKSALTLLHISLYPTWKHQPRLLRVRNTKESLRVVEPKIPAFCNFKTSKNYKKARHVRDAG
jgi:hypothetical protein